MTLFAERLGATPFIFGLLAAAPFAASLLSLPAAVWSDFSGRRKGIFLWALYSHRLLWIPIAALPPLLLHQGALDGAGALGLFVGLMVLMHCCGAVGGPAWMSWMADVIPRRVRGRYFACRRQWGIASALPTALLVGFVLDRFARGAGASDMQVLLVCGAIFCASALPGVIDIALFHLVPHERPEPAPAQSGESFGQILRRLLGSLGVPLRNRRFLAFAGFVAMLTFATAPSGTFVTLFLVQKLHINSMSIQTMLLVAPMLTQLLVSGLWGRVVDRYGKKITLTLASAGIAPIAFGWAVIAAHSQPGEALHWGWIVLAYVVSAGGGLFWTGIEIANFNYVLDMAGNAPGGHARAGTTTGAGGGYVAVNSVIVNFAGMLGGLFFGKLASATQEVSLPAVRIVGEAAAPAIGVIDTFAILFLASALLRLVATLVFLPLVQEETARRHKARDALRYMTANIYNNVQTAIMQPIRWVIVRPRETFKA
jgi:MFS family permease